MLWRVYQMMQLAIALQRESTEKSRQQEYGFNLPDESIQQTVNAWG